ncbi:hypothetical protein Godav_011744, partial [Gossypium davidsonii]|nr:hypothetical protein [Gossypium davidsonii]MBA0646113.1 hypothetical protein [Gossypium klotzschianum]
IGSAIFKELSIPCKLVLNVVGIEETEALAECLGDILRGLLNINSTMPSWCWEISLNEVFLIGVCAIESVAPSSFHLSGRLISCHCIALGIL